MRRIECPRLATVFGSDSDLEQAVEAHLYLLEMARLGKCRLFDEWTGSIHRNFGILLANLSNFIGKVDALLLCAGWANHLTGTGNAILRNFFKDNHIAVFGVAIEDYNSSVHTQTAIWSITELPGSEVIYKDYVGNAGCLRAAQDAVAGLYPVIELTDWAVKKPAIHRSMEEAVKVGLKIREDKLRKGGM